MRSKESKKRKGFEIVWKILVFIGWVERVELVINIEE